MKSIMYCLFPYDKDSVYAVRTNDDGTFSMRTLMGNYDNQYGPQKRRFDLRQSKPYITVNDFDSIGKALAEIKAYDLSRDMDSIGFRYDTSDRALNVSRAFSQAGYNDDHLFVVTTRKTYDEEIDCRLAIINRRDVERIDPFTKEPFISGPGRWRWHRYDEMKYLKEEALNMIDRNTAYKMAVDLFMAKWEEKLADFKEWCGVEQ